MKIKGKQIMLFLDQEAIAAVTNTTISFTANTSNEPTKDDPEGSHDEINWIDWEASSDTIVSTTDESGLGIDALLDAMHDKKVFDVAVSSVANYAGAVPTEGWAADGKVFGTRTGKAVITALNITANNGETAKGSITLKGQGELSKAAEA